MLCAAGNNFIRGFYWSVGQHCKGKQPDWDASNPFAFTFLLNMCITEAWRVMLHMPAEQKTIGCTRRTGALWIGNDFSPSCAHVHWKCNSLFSMKKKIVSSVESHNQLVEVYTENVFSKQSREQSFRQKVLKVMVIKAVEDQQMCPRPSSLSSIMSLSYSMAPQQ